MKCERSILGDLERMWKIHFIGGKKDECAKIESQVMQSKYADSTKKKWNKSIRDWETTHK